MERFINKIDGSEHKLDLMTFLRIRKIPIERYLSDNEINSSKGLEIFLLNLEASSHFSVSDVFKNEARQIFHVAEAQQEQENEEIIIATTQEQPEENSAQSIKYKKKKSQID